MIGKSSRNLKVSRLLFCFVILKTHFSKFRGYFKCVAICVIIGEQAAGPKGIQAANLNLKKRKDPPYGRHHL